MIQKKKSERNGTVKSVLPSVWVRTFTPNSSWPDKDEFLDVLYWLRQIVAIIIGIGWGFLPLKGIIGIALFCMVNTAFVYIYACWFQEVDEDDYGGNWEFAKEGFMTTMAGFLVTWIIVYTGIYGESLGLQNV